MQDHGHGEGADQVRAGRRAQSAGRGTARRRHRFGLAAAFALVASALAFSVLAFSAPKAEAANWLELNFWLSGPNFDGVIPACDDRAALDLISARFTQTEQRFWHTGLAIASFERVQEIAYRPWGEENQPRRYCSGTIYTNDARKRSIYYSIIESGGYIGATWGVEWCVVGLDRSYAYAPTCKMARP